MGAEGAVAAGRRTVMLADLRRLLREPSPIRIVVALKAIVFPEPQPPPQELPQLALWTIDADGLPPRPWRIQADDLFRCRTLGCDVDARRCVMRQLVSEVQRTKDGWRGQASEYPSCVTEGCAQGRGVREALDPHAGVAFRGVGPGGRFQAERRRCPPSKQTASAAGEG